MKLTVIGGGGVRSMFLAKSIAQRAADLHITELVFMDNDPEKLRIYGGLAAHVSEMLNPTLKFRLTEDPVDAVADADYVITTIRVGGDHTRVRDERIALDLGVTNVNEGFYCSGKITIDGSTVRCWGNPHGAETMRQGLQNSCNPVFVELGLRIGVDRFYDYMAKYGVGSPTGVDIAGEGNGIMIARERVKRVDMARIGFGQSIAVTPIQLITAASAAVNGGRLMKPYVVSEIADANGEIIERREPEVVSTPISEKTSATMRDLLEGVVEEGGGRNAHIDGYRIGGKTGTAQVYVDGVVSSGTHIGSFIGFAPIDEPRVAVLFIVDEANRHPDFGSVTAAPFARDILEKTLAYLGVPRKTEKDVSARTLSVPDVTLSLIHI